MQPILIHQDRAELKQQLDFLIRQEFIMTYGRYKRLPFYLIGATLVILVVALFTSTDSLIVFKGVSLVVLALAWIIALGFSIVLLIKWIQRTTWRDKSINTLLVADTDAYMVFDNDKLTFITDTYRSDINWEFYKYYGEDKASIYIFPERNLYEALYFSRRTIGEDNFKQLQAIAKSKLRLVGEENGT